MDRARERFYPFEDWLGLRLNPRQRDSLLRYERWLEEEAAPAGGIGPAETGRLFDRHVGDSLAFLAGMPDGIRTAVDVGGGVGLPSIPLAIALPDVEFTLVDRSVRRSELATRAARILGMANYSVITGEVHALRATYDIATFRASLSIRQAADVLPYCLEPDGTGLFAVSRQAAAPAIPSAPEGITFELSREGDRILASPFWLLKMHRS